MISKRQYQELFVKASWIYHIWDKDNPKAKRFMEWSRQHLDPQWCVRASQQISDLDLRRRWMQARIDGLPLPRVTPAVREHMEREFQRSFPMGVSDPEKSTL